MTQKERERAYLNEALSAAPSIFPHGKVENHDPLDFLIEDVGIEMTELCREHERGEAARLGYVASRAKQRYTARPGATPVSVSPVFSRAAQELGLKALVKGLADFVHAHRDCHRSFSASDGLPAGYSHIGIFPRLELEANDGEWRHFRAGDTVLASKDLLEERIAAKDDRVAAYREDAVQVWLLMVNDLFVGPGEVAFRDEDIAEWSFGSKFDRLLLFERQPGGSGKVSELLQH